MQSTILMQLQFVQGCTSQQEKSLKWV